MRSGVADSLDVAVDTLIVACGNPMRGDDGVGPIVAEQVEASLPQALHASCRVIITHQLLPEHALELAQTRRAVLIDARVTDGEPVGAVRIDTVVPEKSLAPCKSQTGAESGLTHHWTFPRLLAIAEALYGHIPEAYTVSVSADAFDDLDTLSPPIKAAVPQMRDHVLQIIQSA